MCVVGNVWPGGLRLPSGMICVMTFSSSGAARNVSEPDADDDEEPEAEPPASGDVDPPLHAATQTSALAARYRRFTSMKSASAERPSDAGADSDRTADASAAQAAVATGILRQVLLVIFLGVVELWRGKDF